MNHGDALTVAVSATMALILASRAIRSGRLSARVKAGMAAVWVVLIVLAAMIAAWWRP